MVLFRTDFSKVGLACLIFSGIAFAEFKPKLKWLYMSSGIYMDRWAGSGKTGNGLAWAAKDRYLNPPQTLGSISVGGAMAITSKVGLSLNIPVFYNTFDEYVNRNGITQPGDHRSGIGDFEIGIPIKVGKATLQSQLAIPGPYDTEYLVPWTGFGVYRGTLGLAYAIQAHSIWSAGERVLYKPSGKNSGLVEEGDYSLKGGYSYKAKLNPMFNLKGGLDLTFTSFTWQPSSQPQYTFSADPKFSISFLPRNGQELSLTTSVSAYSLQRGEPDFRSYASRRIFIGAYYGLYF